MNSFYYKPASVRCPNRCNHFFFGKSKEEAQAYANEHASQPYKKESKRGCPRFDKKEK